MSVRGGWLWGGVAWLSYAPTLWAVEESGTTGPDLIASSWKAVGALLLVLGLVFVIAWLARRYLPFLSPTPLRDGKDLRLVAHKSLGPKKSLILLDVEGHRMLIGVSESGITLLKDFKSASAEKL